MQQKLKMRFFIEYFSKIENKYAIEGLRKQIYGKQLFLRSIRCNLVFPLVFAYLIGQRHHRRKRGRKHDLGVLTRVVASSRRTVH